MNKEQTLKILKVSMIATLVILLCEIVFSIPEVSNWFANLVISSGALAYVVIWIIMFIQVTILNIPAYVILSASVSIGIKTLSFPYILTVLSAYIAGCILAYWLGRKFGIKAVKWCAGSDEDYNKWSNFINTKGKFFYFMTVLLPLFPDDLLCLVCGATKMNFTFYTIANIIGRGIGLVVMLLTLQLIGSINTNFPYMIIVWMVALLIEFIAHNILLHKRG